LPIGLFFVEWPSARKREAGLAEFKRELIRAGTDEGRKRALARGERLGRKPKLSPFQVLEAIAHREAGEALADIGPSYGVNHSTISRLKRSRRTV
jgi:DNA invertase Pin-like site-specific DNA recombinase